MQGKIEHIKSFTQILFLVFATIFWQGCKTISSSIPATTMDKDIVGSWEGCDGRVVTFTKQKSGEIIGRYTHLGGLGEYRFTQDEIGYKVAQKELGTYTGLVKWRNATGEVTWKKVMITIEDNVYKDNNSDGCSKEMKRIGQR
ncbi:hypothetical protein V1387_16045 [Allomuricauda taeanensis]|uniref:hypothetical protein n=1 Tax=Flagellimonas taeanensis TaxID=1005926 RepID=UPI002E7B6738|nr:hypothetical protein [Allomuricauda taeanensis]MEE1964204.1 hypothetical protein [Allomuricauda taeanensis]